MSAPTLQPRALVHVNQVVQDIDVAEQWYARLYGATRFYRGFSDAEQRDASLLLVGSACIELFCPRDQESVLGRFLTRFGEGFHSFEWDVADLDHALAAFTAREVRITAHWPGAFFMTHPRDCHGMLLEICAVPMPGDPRLAPGFTPDPGPLGIVGIRAIRVAVPDLDDAAAFVRGLLGRQQRRLGQDAVAFDLPDHVLELAVVPGSVGIDSVEFTVTDLAATAAALKAAGVPVVDDRPGMLAIAREDNFGALHLFRAQT